MKNTQRDLEDNLFQVRLSANLSRDEMQGPCRYILWDHFKKERERAIANKTEMKQEVPEVLKNAHSNLIKNMENLSVLAEFRLDADGDFHFVRLLNGTGCEISQK